MKRRTFLAAAGSLCAFSASGTAQTDAFDGASARRNPRPLVIFLDDRDGPQGALLDEFRSALAAKGVLPRVDFEVLTVPATDEKVLRKEIANALLRKPALFVTASSDVALLATRVAETSLVFGTMADPIRFGLVDRIGPRQKNVTGFTYDVPIARKSLEVLADAFPTVRRTGVIADPNWAKQSAPAADFESIERRLGICIDLVIEEDSKGLFARLRELDARIDAWYLPRTDLLGTNSTRLIEFFQSMRKPHLLPHEGFVRQGALLSYGLRMNSHWDSMARMVRLIVAGVPAREIPVERPKDFVLAVNMDQARRMGIRIPKRILRRADLIV
jgi:putative ABC transport system substrate-binding protein